MITGQCVVYILSKFARAFSVYAILQHRKATICRIELIFCYSSWRRSFRSRERSPYGPIANSRDTLDKHSGLSDLFFLIKLALERVVCYAF